MNTIITNKDRILVIGTKWWGKWSEQLAEAFTRSGNQATHINIHNLFSPQFYHHWQPHERFLQLDIKKKNEKIIEAIIEFQPDIIISVNVDVCSVELLKLCQRQGIKTFLWLGDSPSCYNNIENFSLYNKVAIWDDYYIQSLNLLSGTKATYLPTCGDDHIFKPVKADKDIDLLFIGNAFVGNAPLRASLLAKLIEQIGQQRLKVQIYGDDNWLALAKKYPVLQRSIINRIVSPEEANVLYNQAKIVLNIHHPQNIQSTSARTYEIGLAKTFQLVEYKKAVPELFEGTGIVTFSTLTELVEKVNYFLSHDTEREQIAEHVYQKAKKNHTYDVRTMQIKRMIEDVS